MASTTSTRLPVSSSGLMVMIVDGDPFSVTRMSPCETSPPTATVTLTVGYALVSTFLIWTGESEGSAARPRLPPIADTRNRKSPVTNAIRIFRVIGPPPPPPRA